MKLLFDTDPEELSFTVFSPEVNRAMPLPVRSDFDKKVQNFHFRCLKRGLDVLLSVFVLLLVNVWLIPLLAILIFLDQGFPLFFIQERVGRDNRRFRCYKLRTMYFCTVSNRPKATRLGRILRLHKLDELPQFINVLKGEMSLVGPRPHMESDHEAFSRIIGDAYHYRHLVKPGITGLAQVNGYEGPIHSREKLRGRIRMDLTYVRDWSWRVELGIIVKTVIMLWSGLVKTRKKR